MEAVDPVIFRPAILVLAGFVGYPVVRSVPRTMQTRLVEESA